jgi:hypothetical protein
MAYVRDECPVSVYESDPKVAGNRSLDNCPFRIPGGMILIYFVNGRLPAMIPRDVFPPFSSTYVQQFFHKIGIRFFQE